MSELFPQATQILDPCHAKEHLDEVGKVIYGDGPEGKAWIEARSEEVDEGHLKSFVHALRCHVSQHKEARDFIHYIWKNRRRMRYPEFEKQDFYTSTGVEESTCKVVFGTRLKRGHALGGEGSLSGSPRPSGEPTLLLPSLRSYAQLIGPRIK